MADFYEEHLIDPMKKIVTLYYHEANNTEDNLEKDEQAAIKIQAKYRMFIKKKWFTLIRNVIYN